MDVGSARGTAAAEVAEMLEGLSSMVNYTAAKEMLDAVVLRQQALASNLANVGTPGYRRLDVDPSFQRELAAELKRADGPNLSNLRSPRLYEDPLAGPVRGDGNNVSLEDELLAMNQNSLNHQFLTDYVSNSIKHLRTAITGRTNG